MVSPTALDIARRMEDVAKQEGVPNDFVHRSALRKSIGMGSVKQDADHYFDTDLAEERVRIG